MRIDYMAHLRRALEAFEVCLDGDLSVPIEHCGQWTLHDLANHVGRANLWTAAAVTEGRNDHRPPRAPRERAESVAWFDNGAATLLDALDRDPSRS